MKSAIIRKLALSLALLILISALYGIANSQGKSNYLWPVKHPKVKITSVLFDKRSGHPHGGIDISLFGQVGTIPIVAVEDGLLMRIRDSKYGYGRALYIRSADKQVAVYAHLDHFSQRLQSVAEDLRDRLGLQYLDYYYETWEMNVAVKKGEIIGYGGNTGTSTAHLHFEIRYDDQVNLNPLTHGFSVPDNVAPTINKIVLVPVDPDASIDGVGDQFALTESDLAKWTGCTECPPPPQITGRVGISVDAHDRQFPKGRSFGPYRITVRVDDAPFFETRYEEFSYADETVWYTQFDYETGTHKRLLRAYNPHPVDIPHFSAPDSGTFDSLPPGDHQVEVEAADANGNTTLSRFPIRIPEGQTPSPRPWPVGSGSLKLFNDQSLPFDNGRFNVIAYDKTFFQPVKVDIHAVNLNKPAAVGSCYTVSEPGIYLRQRFGLQFHYDSQEKSPNRLGIYRKTTKGLQWLGADIDYTEGTVTAKTMTFGTFCLGKDIQGPIINNIDLKPGGNPLLKFKIRDGLSGMARDFVMVHIDGEMVRTDFKPAKNTATAHPSKSLGKGSHKARITAVDNAGNIVEKTVPFTVK